MKTSVLLAAVLSGVMASSAAFAQANSEYTVTPENEGLTFHFTNRAYDWINMWDGSGTPQAVLLLETEDRTVSNMVDGTFSSHVRVEASTVSPQGEVTPLYSFDDPGEAGDVRWIAFEQTYYEAVNYGCCGAFDSRRTYSLRNGNLLFSHTVPPVWFEIPNAGGLVRLVGVHTIFSMDDAAVFGERQDALALVTFASPTEPLQKILIAMDGTLSSEELEYPEATVGWSEKGEAPQPELTVWSADGQSDLSLVEGLALVVSFPPNLRVDIPVVAGRLDIASATIAPGLRLEEVPLAP